MRITPKRGLTFLCTTTLGLCAGAGIHYMPTDATPPSRTRYKHTYTPDVTYIPPLYGPKKPLSEEEINRQLEAHARKFAQWNYALHEEELPTTLTYESSKD